LVEKGGRKNTFERGREVAPEKGEESSHSVHTNGMNE